MRLAILALAVACSGGSASTKTEPKPTDEIAIANVTVVPMDRQGTLADHTVIVRGGRIAEVGPAATTKPAPGATVIDGRGKWLIPGLADMHVHTYDPLQLALFVSMGVTTIRVLWGDPSVIGVRDAIAKGEQRLAPAIFTAGSIVDGKPPIWPGSTGIATANDAQEVVVVQHATGYDFVKIYNLLPKPAYEAVVAEAARLRMPVIGHVPASVGLFDVLAAKQHSIEHLEGYALAVQRDDSPVRTAPATDFKTRMGAFKFEDPAKLADAIARTKAAGTWNCPTLIVIDRISNLDKPDLARPEFRFVPKGLVASWDPKQDFRFRSWTPDDYKIAREGAVWRGALVKKLVDAGAGIVAGTDVGNPHLVPGFSLHQELEVLVASKLTTFEALQAATAAPARMLGTQSVHGTVVAGARGDLVLLDADPLADIRNTQKIAGVMLRGRWLPAPMLAAERERIAAIYAGTKSRFDAPLPKDAVFAAQFRGENSRASGEQRVVASGAGAALRITGETRTDFEADARWEIDPGADGRGARVHVRHDGLDVVFARDGDKLRVRGTLGRSNVETHFPLAADETIGGAPLAMDQLAYRRLVKLAVGATEKLKLAVIDTRTLHVSRMELDATRKPDAQRTIAGKLATVRVFGISVSGQGFEIALDADGWLVDHHEYKRVD